MNKYTPDRRTSDRRVVDYDNGTDDVLDKPMRRFLKDRRVSQSISTFAIQECARLRQELQEARAQSTEDHTAMLAALGESMRLRTVNAELIAILRDWRATELDTMDEEYQPWMDQFTARVDAAITKATS